MKHALSMLALAVLVACGGDRTNVASTDDATRATPAGGLASATSAASAAPSSDAPPVATSSATAAPEVPSVNPDTLVADVRIVCQAVLDAPQLAQYIAPSPRRVPLHLVPRGPCNGLSLEKHGKPVVFDGGPRDVSITEIALTGSGARAKMHYGDQGIVGELDFERVPGGFRIVRGSVVEH